MIVSEKEQVKILSKLTGQPRIVCRTFLATTNSIIKDTLLAYDSIYWPDLFKLKLSKRKLGKGFTYDWRLENIYPENPEGKNEADGK